MPIDWPSAPSNGQILTFGALVFQFDGVGWRLSSSFPDALRGSATASLSLSNGANGTTTITLPKSCVMLSIATDRAALVVLYSSAAAATADAGRAWATVAPSAGAGVIAQGTLTAAGTLQFDPTPIAANREGTVGNTYTLRAINNGSTGSMSITINYITMQL